METQEILEAPSIVEVRNAVAMTVLSGEKRNLPLMVDEGTDGKPKHVWRQFPILGFMECNISEYAAICIFTQPHVRGSDAGTFFAKTDHERSARIYLYTDGGPEGNPGHIEINDEK